MIKRSLLIFVLLLSFNSMIFSQNTNFNRYIPIDPPQKGLQVFWFTVLCATAGGALGGIGFFAIQAPKNPYGERSKGLDKWIAGGAIIGGLLGLVAGISISQKSAITISEKRIVNLSLPDLNYDFRTESINISLLKYDF